MQAPYLSKEIFKNAKVVYLSKEDLLKVIRKYKRTKNDEEKDRLRDVVVNSNLRLVISLSYGYAMRTQTNPDDLFQNGIIGVIVALEKFKPRKGFAFSTYAVPWINKYIGDAVGSDTTISTKRFLSGSPHALLYRRLFIKSNGDNDKFTKLLRAKGITQTIQNRIEHVMGVSRQSSYIDLYSMIGDTDMRMIDIIEDKDGQSPYDLASKNTLNQKLHKLIEKNLTTKERSVIECLYFDEMTISKTAEVVGVSKQTVSNLEQRAIKKLIRCFVEREKIDVKHGDIVVEEKVKSSTPIKDLVSHDTIKKYLRSTYDATPVSEMPLRRYEIYKKDDVYGLLQEKTTYKVISPTMRGAINFVRDKTHLYHDLAVVKMDGQPFGFSTPTYMIRDMSKPMAKRVREEVNASRWEEIPNGRF